MPPNVPEHYAELEGRLGHSFRDRGLLEAALTHRSFANEARRDSLTARHNERLEFLGDAVLGLVVAHLLMDACPDRSEGALSQLRARVVNEASLAQIAARLDLGQWLFLGRGEVLTGGRHKPSLLADSCEALLGAVYLDGGFEAARGVIQRLVGPHLEAEIHGLAQFSSDAKSRLQEQAQALQRGTPRYELVGESGPDHRKQFEVAVYVGEQRLAQAQGASKREAEQRAAAAALALLG